MMGRRGGAYTDPLAHIYHTSRHARRKADYYLSTRHILHPLHATAKTSNYKKYNLTLNYTISYICYFELQNFDGMESFAMETTTEQSLSLSTPAVCLPNELQL